MDSNVICGTVPCSYRARAKCAEFPYLKNFLLGFFRTDKLMNSINMDGESDDLANVSYFSFSEKETRFCNDPYAIVLSMRVFNVGRGKFVYLSHVSKPFWPFVS